MIARFINLLNIKLKLHSAKSIDNEWIQLDDLYTFVSKSYIQRRRSNSVGNVFASIKIWVWKRFLNLYKRDVNAVKEFVKMNDARRL